MSSYQLAELNIAHLRAPLTDPMIADFVNQLDEINKLADESPGFIWRLQTEDGDATALRVFDNDAIIVNLTVWESIEALHNYAYQGKHVEAYRRRRDWFEKMENPSFAMWWIPADYRPTIDEAKAKYDLICTHGATPLAFNFKQRYSVEDLLKITELK